MSYQTQGTIMGYDPASDSCVVELTGLGMLDTWLTGLKPEAQVNRAFLKTGVPCTISMPDAHRLCEARVIAVTDTPAVLTIVTPTASQSTQTGVVRIACSLTGSGSTTVTFSPAFSAPPTVTVNRPQTGVAAVSSLTATGFTVTVSGGSPFEFVQIPWHAVGNT
ncbi:MAG: hypothetical protein NVS4B2_26420 [Chloroflexota bacterium]